MLGKESFGFLQALCLHQMALPQLAALAHNLNSIPFIDVFTISLILTFPKLFPVQKPLG